MKRYLLLATCCISGILSFSQQKEIDSLLKALSSYHKEDTIRLNLLNNLTYIYYNIDPEKGLSTGDQAISLGKKLNNRLKLAEAYRSKGINQWAKGEYPAALELYGYALQIFEELKYKKGMTQTYNNTGVVYMYMSDYPKALGFFLKALPLSEEMNNKTGIANACTNIGIIYKNLSNYSKAVEYYQKALDQFKVLDNKQGMASVLSNIGTVYDLTGQPEKALEYYQKGITLNREIGNKRGIASDLVNMGIVYQGMSRFPEAHEYLTESLKLYEEAGDKNNLIVVLNSLGAVIADASKGDLRKININESERFTKALALENRALLLAREIQATDEEYQVLETMSTTYEKKKDYAKALESHKKFIALRDSVINDEKKEEITRKEMQFEFDKKEAVTTATHKAELKQQQTVKYAVLGGAVILLIGALLSFIFYKRKKEAVVKKHEAELNAEISDTEMKALRAQMNPHFIFNSLNSISDYIAKNNIKEADNYLTKFAKLIRMILENSEKKEIPLADDLNALELYMQLESLRLNNKFSYEIITDNQIDKENTMVPPLLLQPFVENSIWHGIAKKEGKGKIVVLITKENQMIHCTVEDDGIGRSAAASMNEQVSPRKSLGMKITKSRIAILNRVKKSNASVELSDLSQGTKAQIKLPLELSF